MLCKANTPASCTPASALWLRIDCTIAATPLDSAIWSRNGSSKARLPIVRLLLSCTPGVVLCWFMPSTISLVPWSLAMLARPASERLSCCNTQQAFSTSSGEPMLTRITRKTVSTPWRSAMRSAKSSRSRTKLRSAEQASKFSSRLSGCFSMARSTASSAPHRMVSSLPPESWATSAKYLQLFVTRLTSAMPRCMDSTTPRTVSSACSPLCVSCCACAGC
mmetsp:Transcript_89215/g.257241  ORF Transcript_89215/g.257241 Transcript_89215/m.257241 type:complete len:220 (+) Transcript_89215:446-1105(+)